MVVNDAAHAWEAAVACLTFHVIFLEDGVEIVVWWEVLLDKVEEGFGVVRLYNFAVWGDQIMFYFFS